MGSHYISSGDPFPTISFAIAFMISLLYSVINSWSVWYANILQSWFFGKLLMVTFIWICKTLLTFCPSWNLRIYLKVIGTLIHDFAWPHRSLDRYEIERHTPKIHGKCDSDWEGGKPRYKIPNYIHHQPSTQGSLRDWLSGMLG